MKSFLLSLSAIALLGFITPAAAQNNALPSLPEPIQNLVNDGAQIRYLGKDKGFDAWLTVKGGQEQYFYVLPDQSAFVMGVLFDDSGKLVTVDQVRRLTDNGDTLLSSLANEDEFAGLKKNKYADDKDTAFKSPSERLYNDLENSNWVALGNMNAPVVYSFVDPQCGHCHKLVEDLRGEALKNGQIQLRLIPVGFKDETLAQAAFLLAAPNPQERWYEHMDGNKDALPAKTDINQQGVERNLALMQNWKFDVTPMIIYRDKMGKIKLIRGNPKDMGSMLSDLPQPKA